MAYDRDFEYIVVDCNTKKVKIPAEAYTIATQGDYNVGEIHFMLLNRPSRIDPANCTVTMSYWNACGDHDDQEEAISVVYDKKTMLITLPIPPTLVIKSGKVRVGMTITSDLYKWNLSPVTLFVSYFGPDHTGHHCHDHKDPLKDIIDNIALRVKRLEEAEIVLPSGIVTKENLADDLVGDLVWEEELEEIDGDDILAMWS